jgi:DNA invertase Pin-like site-specific DNA recombinase
MNKNKKYNRYVSKFNADQIKRMRYLYDQGYALRYIARKFNCNPHAVWHRVYDLSPPQKLSAKIKRHYLRNSKLTEVDVRKIRILAVKQGINAVEIGKIYGISQSTALAIINGKTFRWINGETKKGMIEVIEYNYRPKTDLKCGPKPGSKSKVKQGVLIKYAKQYGVKPCTICRWMKKGKFKVKKSELVVA